MGIHVEQIDPRHPEQKWGGDEPVSSDPAGRDDLAPVPDGASAGGQHFDGVCQDFNRERTAWKRLGRRPPARVYVASRRPYPVVFAQPWYDATDQVRRACETGKIIKRQGTRVFLGGALRGELVGWAETDQCDWIVRFMHVELGRIARQTHRFTAAWHGRRRGGRT